KIKRNMSSLKRDSENTLKEPQNEFFIYRHPETDEAFLDEPSKVKELIEFLDAIHSFNKSDSSKEQKRASLNLNELVTDTNFFVNQKPSIGSSSRRSTRRKVPVNTNQFTFMRQIDMDPEDRILARKEREITAETFRRLGNYEYRKMRFDSAVVYYTKGLEYVRDTPVLYVNRAICYIKMREYKRALMDCNYVIVNLDEKYLRAWLYKAAAHKRMNDEFNYNDSIFQARHTNFTEQEFINDFVDQMRSLL
ncbi:hypothetical protein KR018_001190, partial [Drosophila ironensis]